MRTIGVKFCGGCHPGYDRGKVFRKIREMYTELSFETVQECGVYDDLLLICGCTSRCASTQPYRVRNRRIWIDHTPDPGEIETLFDAK